MQPIEKTAPNPYQELRATRNKVDDYLDSLVDRLSEDEDWTGEIPEESLKELEKIESNKLSMITQLVSRFIYYKNVEKIESEQKKLFVTEPQKWWTARVNRAKKRQESIKRFLMSHIEVGQKYKEPTFSSWWTPSPVVEVDPELDLAKVYKDHPELIDVTYTVNKDAVKNYKGKLPEGIKVETNHSLVIKGV